ncbi:MAG TPA: hypothetical protein PKV71_06680, partial [Calditrichia bacterium]|nr:hypothetical protein [Calditrichia bacterium]
GSSVDQIILDPNAGGDNTVQLPNDAVNPAEMYAEPGVAGDLDGQTILTIPQGTFEITNRRLSIPADGYLLVIATCETRINHRGTTIDFLLGLSDINGTLYTNQDLQYYFAAEQLLGAQIFPSTIHMLIPVKQGNTIIYFFSNLTAGAGDVQIGDVNFSMAYFPTAYGSVTAPILGKQGTAAAAEEQPASAPDQPMSTGEIQTELKRLTDRIEALQKQIENQ